MNDLSAAANPRPVIGLAEFVEATTTHTLDPWQRHLCELLETLSESRGRRVLIHAPPQLGKSIIVSQRYPAWLLAKKPKHKVKLACYNVTHATRFGKVVRDLMQSDSFIDIFPDSAVRLPTICAAHEWSTLARAQALDSQPSFKALGLATGFVGQGADTLIIDDPYASPEEAYSSTINGHVRTFWTDTALPRLNDETNVIVMFHRYTEDDLAGWLMEEEPDKWELYRYAAVADGSYKHPYTEVEYPDPLGREEGERLSTRFSDEWYAEKKANSFVWRSQFQGRPTAKGGLFFKEEWFEIVKAVPADAVRARYWDKAGAAEGKGDWTVGLLMARSGRGLYFIEDVVRFQLTSHNRNQRIKQVAELDRQRYGHVPQFIEQPPGLAKESTDEVIRVLDGYPVHADPVSGDKVERAEPLQSQAEAGNVKMVAGLWNREFLQEMAAFPAGKHDDQVDAATGAHKKLRTLKEMAVGVAGVKTSTNESGLNAILAEMEDANDF